MTPAAPQTYVRRAVVAAALAVAFAGSAFAQTPAPVTVFAAASLKNLMDAVGTAYTAKTHAAVRFSYAASSALARQIEQGAPADVFISADPKWMDYVASRGLVAPGSRRDVLSNHLALIAPISSAIKLKLGKAMPLAAALGSGRLAMAGPDVPAGIYGQAALTTLGVWDGVKDKLARAENVRAALAFVARGETPLGIVYDTDARVEPQVRIVGLFPDDSHPPIIYPAASVTASTNADARAFLAFLDTSQARALYRRYGFIALRPNTR